MSKTSRYFWLKMPKDFFKRHDVRIVEGMPDGKEMLLLYMKLLCESLDHEGNLRYSDRVPYTDEMIATITNTDLNIVEKAMELFLNLGLIDILEDETIVMTKVPEMTGSETHAAKYMRERRGQSEEITLGEFENVRMTKEELQKLREFYPTKWSEYIERLSSHKQSKGTVYDSDYATIKQWLIVDVGEME